MKRILCAAYSPRKQLETEDKRRIARFRYTVECLCEYRAGVFPNSFEWRFTVLPRNIIKRPKHRGLHRRNLEQNLHLAL